MKSNLVSLHEIIHNIDHSYINKLEGHVGKPWSYYAKKADPKLISTEALDLLDKFLRYDHAERILPRDAMKHPYFLPILGDNTMD